MNTAIDPNNLPTCLIHRQPICDRAGNEVVCPKCEEDALFSVTLPTVAKKFGDRPTQAMPTPDSRVIALPPLEAGFVRVLTSVSHKIYDVPVASLQQARDYDPKIRILQV